MTRLAPLVCLCCVLLAACGSEPVKIEPLTSREFNRFVGELPHFADFFGPRKKSFDNEAQYEGLLKQKGVALGWDWERWRMG